MAVSHIAARILAVCCIAALQTPCLAVSTPSASLKTFSQSMVADWAGRGDVHITANLCITSQTGHYQLTLMAPPLFRDQLATSPIQITFRDTAGNTRTDQWSGQLQIEFNGTTSSAGADCSNGEFAALEMVFPETLLTAQQAGDYFSQIALSVRPI